jgi:tetratricopeptide (TPR) repeat protein
MPRKEWRQTVLPNALRSAWKNPQELASAIQLGLELGCAPDVVHAARHLFESDPNRARSVRLLAEALMYSRELFEAQRLLELHLEQHGDESGVLASLAKLRYARGRTDWCEKLLWRALTLNPNEYMAVSWAAGIARERGGDQAQSETVRRIAAMPGSWRAQLSLAWEALNARKLEEALQLYAQALQNAPEPMPAELLMTIGDGLGSKGHLIELVNLVGPRFKPVLHGLNVGARLLQAHLDLGQLDAASAILSHVRAVKNVGWDDALLFWEMQIANARGEVADRVEVTPENVLYLGFDGPLWLDAASPAAELFPARPPYAAAILLLMHTFEWAELDKESKLKGAASIYARALPPFFAEQLEFCLAARARIVTPWVAEGGIPFFAGCSDSDAAAFAGRVPDGCDYVLTGHLKAGGKSGHLELRLVRVKDAKLLGAVGANIDLERPHLDCIPLTNQLLELVNKQTGAAVIMAPGQYRPPLDAEFISYLVGLEELLCVRCMAKAPPTNPDFCIAKRTIIERAIRFALAFPRNVTIRLLLAQTALAMSKVDAPIVGEFRNKLALLHKEHTLSEPTNSVVRGLINAALAADSKAEPI